MQGASGRLRPDFWLGLILAAGGAWAANEAYGFDERSWAYPFSLAVALAGFGAVIALRVLIAPGRDNSAIGSPHAIATAALPGGVVLALWAWALSAGAGYLIPSVLAASALAVIAGVRDPLRIAAYGLGTAAAVFVLFGILFNTPLPLLEPVKALLG